MSLSTQDFHYICNLILDRSAIVLGAEKEYLVDLRLGILADQEGFPSISALVKQLTQTGDAGLSKKVVDALTTNETLFFRDFRPFEYLKSELLPQLIESRRHSKSLRIWSAACSTGQEPYSIAMIIDKHFPELKNWQVEILATDLSFTCLEYARKASYNQFEVNRGLPASYLVSCFDKSGDRWELKPQIRQRVQFRELNLIDPWQMPPMDMIFLRNVLIYFSPETKRTILSKIKTSLKTDSVLFLGGSETTLHLDPNYHRIDSKYNVNCYTLDKNKNKSRERRERE